MSLTSNLFRAVRPVLTVFALATAASLPVARGATVESPFAIGLKHTKAAPYNFTGRVFDFDTPAFGSGALIRRHTVVTAGHVVFDPTTGFIGNATFTRALYEDFKLSTDQVISVAALGGYQSVATTDGNTALSAFALDQGYVLLHDAPVDENWANFVTDPTLLVKSPTFVLGYPGVTFDGLTLAYVVPPNPYVAVGTSLTTGAYANSNYNAEEGMSGGPIFVVPDGVHQSVAATTVGGFATDGGTTGDTTGEFTQAFVRAIDKTSGKFLTDAEYTSGLISSVTLTGPKKVNRNQTYSYTATINFLVPSVDGSAATTDRYGELKLKSNAGNTKTTNFVTIVKTSNTTFNVTYTGNLRPGAVITLQVYYDKTATPVGKSSKIVKVQQ